MFDMVYNLLLNYGNIQPSKSWAPVMVEFQISTWIYHR